MRSVTYSVELLEATINKQVERIEALETALTIFADDENWRYGRRLDPNGSRFDGTSIAQIALAKGVRSK